MSEENEGCLGVFELDLLEWGVSESEARQTAQGWLSATLLRGKKEWTLCDPESVPNCDPEGLVAMAQDGQIEISEKLLEEACFASYQGNISALSIAIEGIPILKNRFEEDPTAFWIRLSKYSSQKHAGRNWIDKQPPWIFFAFEFWINSKKYPPSFPGCPPVCLWTDSAIRTVFESAPSSDNSVRKKLAQVGLSPRPEGFAYQYIDGSWEKCARMHTKKK